MGLRRVIVEGRARGGLAALALAIPLTVGAAWWTTQQPSGVVLHGRVSEAGGWLPQTLHASVGTPLRLRLISDDVVHGFAIGQSDAAPLDLPPGKMVETTLTFDRAGIYTYYCTRWCGPNHWRMRGVIEVSGPATEAPPAVTPLYVQLGIDLDAPHPAAVIPRARPSAQRGEAVGVPLPVGARNRGDFVARPPAETWLALRRDPTMRTLGDSQVWDLVAQLWRSTTTDAALAEGRALFAQNCAACHGAGGGGDGVMASSIVSAGAHDGGGGTAGPADFTDPATMLGASSALLQGKILRGGMGTGMPYWGPILTEAQLWALTDYLWTFQFGDPS